MLKKEELTADLSVGPQIRLDDLQTLADLGFRSIICNRPDGEAPDQPTFDQISAAASALNIEAKHIPVGLGQVNSHDAEIFNSTLRDLAHPTFAYCQSGFRSKKLWSLSQPNNNALSSRLVSMLKDAGSGLMRNFHRTK